MCRGRGSGARVQVQREGGTEGKRREEKLSRAWHTWHGLALAVTCKALALHESVVTELMTSTAAGPWLLNLYQLIAFALKATGASAAAEGGMQDRVDSASGLRAPSDYFGGGLGVFLSAGLSVERIASCTAKPFPRGARRRRGV